MTRRRTAPLVVALLCSVLLAACGSSGSSTTSGSTATSTSATTASAPATTSTVAPRKPATTSTTATTVLPATPQEASGVKAYVAICKLIIAREPTLAASTKNKVEGICKKAAGGNLAGARAAAKEVCVEVIYAAPIPAAQKARDSTECKLT
jgi:hypothetical protein